MNDGTSVQTATFLEIELSDIEFSSSSAQAERREHFDPAAMKELVENVKAIGIIQPIVVRPRPPASTSKKLYELVAGERRVVASRKAGLTTAPAMIRQLNNDQALDLQLCENLQREGLHELAEAEGYETLLKHGMKPEEIADKVAKSKSYVYARMKLIDLGKAGREEFYKGTINASVALLVARIPGDELQERALKKITEIDPYHKTAMSFREVQRYVQDEFTLKLAGAPFPREDLELVPAAGACSACPRRSGNQPADLFGDIKSADVCTDPVCFKAKRTAFQKRELEKANTTGAKVIKGSQATRILPGQHAWGENGKQLRNGYARPSDKCLDDPKKRTYAELAGVDVPTVLLQDPKNGRVSKVIEIAAIAEKLKEKGIKIAVPAKDNTEQREIDRARQEKAQELQLQTDIAVFQAVRAAAPAKFAREDLEQIAMVYFEHGFGDDTPRFKALGWDIPKGKTHMNTEGWAKQLQRLTEAELARLIIVLPALEAVLDSYGRTPELEALAKRFGVDTKKVRAEITAAAAKPVLVPKSPVAKKTSKVKAKTPVKAKKKKKAKS